MTEIYPEAVSVSQMARLLQLSRSRLYQLIDEGVLLPPVYLLTTRRPIYTQNMIIRNVEVKKTNMGINNQVVIFYSKQFSFPQKRRKLKPQTEPKTNSTDNRYEELIEELSCLGLEDISVSKIDSALSELFPDGTKQVDPDEILRSVCRYLKRQNNEHKHRT